MLVVPIGKKFFKHPVGEVFELADRAALKLIEAGLLARAQNQDAEISERTGLPKRQYRRRDLTAQSI